MTPASQPAPPPRRRRTARSVIFADRVTGAVIRTGGILVVVAVLGICVFLAATVVPLFGGAQQGSATRYPLPGGHASELLLAEVDEYQLLGMALLRDGTLTVFDAQRGQTIRTQKLLPDGAAVRCASRNAEHGSVAFGLADGRVIPGRIGMAARFLAEADVPAELRGMTPGSSRATAEGMAFCTDLHQIRVSHVVAELGEPLAVGATAVERLDFRAGDKHETLAAVLTDGQLVLCRIALRKALGSAKVTRRTAPLELPRPEHPGVPVFVLVTTQGDQIYLAWDDGALARYDLRDAERPILAEETRITTAPARLTQLRFALGEQSLLVGDSSGGCAGWFRVPATGKDAGADGFRMVPAHTLPAQAGAITTLAVSQRDKCFVTGSPDGGLVLRHLTSARILASLDGLGAAPVALQIAPKNDAVFAVLASADCVLWPVRTPHPETTLDTILTPTWYEGYPAPTHTWQSSSGTDDFEPKLGLWPLIFGTLKATLYASLFAIPIALLAAIYTSEYMSRRARGVIKPALEMMASLPSVVLGFFGALILAPWVETRVVPLLTLVLLLPVSAVAAAHLWQCLPLRISARLAGTSRLLAAAVVFAVATILSFPLGAWIEAQWFLGDVRAWLAQPGRGTTAAFWTALSLPLCIVLWHWLWALLANGGSQDGRPAAQLLRAAARLGLALLTATWIGYLANSFGLDPRGALLGTYVQRNTLIVGFVMGFAVIPIVFTIAEDALASVPDGLRAAALGCGATPWQTTVRVVVPTAMSGIFSAIMVGLGRAVGETMIVVMAAGNTPILEVNPFNGLRALSATIAVEMPEAVKDGTLYRMLFLAALTLFAMTFVLNTAAELIRMRFRKRAFEL